MFKKITQPIRKQLKKLYKHKIVRDVATITKLTLIVSGAVSAYHFGIMDITKEHAIAIASAVESAYFGYKFLRR